jgi:two-component system, cell cycle sensor histidine kinase and response regulator CckA
MSKKNSDIKKSMDIERLIAERTAELLNKNMELQHGLEEAKKAEAALQKSEKGFRLLMEHTPDLLFINDSNGKIIDANRIACETLGYTREELLSLSIADIEEHLIEHQEKLKQSARGVPVTFEGIQKRKDGTSFPVEVRLWIFESGEEELIIALVRDISERRSEEEKRKKLEAQLNFSKNIQSIGTLAGGIAHNFNNILMGIQGNVSLMMFDKKPEDRDYKRLNNIQTLIDNGARLTNQLIGYAREGAYYLKPGNLNQIVRETLDFYFKQGTGISIHLELAENLSLISMDKTQIVHVLLDLYSNAADAMPEGGDLFIRTANATHRDIRGKEYQPVPGEYSMLSVRDTGTGMSKEVMSRIFEPFFTTKGLARGSGLGLPSVYGIIKGHQGYIEVESEPGQGATFSIFLPATSEFKQEAEEAPGEFLTGRETILLVDDDEMVLDTGAEILERLGYRVIQALSGSEAIRLFKEHQGRINVVLLDMVMPEIGGGEVFDRIKEINSNIKVLLTSGYSQDGEANEILKRGCDGFIQKPFHTIDLSRKLREILEKK